MSRVYVSRRYLLFYTRSSDSGGDQASFASSGSNSKDSMMSSRCHQINPHCPSALPCT
ncbi:unnamed protein product, partial [Nesidiocoris tenuis]